jgi:pimeloyl-ACP methyl ester carboxylesterase
VSTPTSLDLPAGVRRTAMRCERGTFAVLEAYPQAGACELGTALLVPGYTGSKEDFLPVLAALADGDRRVIAVDLRGQYQTPGPDDPAAYDLAELGADVAALADATGATHLLGHSFGGLVARAAVLADEGALAATGQLASITLMSSGPGPLTGARAKDLDFFLGAIGDISDPGELRAKVSEIWHGSLKPQAIASGVTAPVVEFLQDRMLASNPTGLVTMARQLLAADDRTADLAARGVPVFVLYGEDDNAWATDIQEDMALRLGARRACIPGAAHSPAVEAPATTVHALTDFWDATEGITATAVIATS